MIVSNMNSPKKSLYILGAAIIESFKDFSSTEVSPILLFNSFQRKTKFDSFPYYTYALDWLFLIGAIEITAKGDLKICN